MARLVSLLFPLLACSLSTATDSTPGVFVISQPETYEAVGFDGPPLVLRAGSSLNHALVEEPVFQNLLMVGRGDPRGLLPYLRDRVERTWRRALPHPFLAKVLPGVTFYSVSGDADGFQCFAPEPEFLVGMKDSLCCILPYEMNRLLRSAGVRFGPDDIGTWMRTAALFWAADARRKLLDGNVMGMISLQLHPDSVYSRHILFPRLVIDSACLDPHKDGWADPALLRLRVDTLPPFELRVVFGYRGGTDVAVDLVPYELWGGPSNINYGLNPP